MPLALTSPLGWVHNLGHGGSLQHKAIPGEGLSCTRPITNTPYSWGNEGFSTKGEGWSWAVPHSILSAFFLPSPGSSFLICQKRDNDEL